MVCSALYCSLLASVRAAVAGDASVHFALAPLDLADESAGAGPLAGAELPWPAGSGTTSFELPELLSAFGFVPRKDVLAWAQEPVAIAICLALVTGITLIGVARARRREVSKPTATVAASDNLDHIYRQYGTSETVGRRGAPVALLVEPQPAGPKSASDTVVIGDAPPAGPRAGVLAWLVPQDAPGDPLPITSATASIGRHSKNDVVLAGETVHRNHAKLVMRELGRFEIEDLGGVNGTVVNGKRCSQALLASGDIIELGEVRVRFVLPEGLTP